MRKRFTRWLSLLAVFFMLAAYGSSAQAALQAVGPTNPQVLGSIQPTLGDGFPAWYQDTTGLAIAQCLDLPSATGGVPYCTLLAGPNFDPALPIEFPAPPLLGNYPVEMFFWVADTTIGPSGALTGAVKIRFALEQTWATGVQIPGQQIVFLMINMSKAKGLPPSTHFTVTHPYGTFTFDTDAQGNTLLPLGGQPYRVRDDAVLPVGVFNTLLPATTTNIGPFLRPSATPGGAALPPIIDPVSGNSYLANPAVLTKVTGSPFGAARNNVTITWPGGTVTQNQFLIQGKIAPPPGTPINVTSSTYSRSATAGQVSVFATSIPTATLSVSGTGFTTTTMLHDVVNPGNFFVNIPTATPALLPGAPALVSIVNTLDPVTVPAHTHPLIDVVSISTANFNPATGILTVKAASSDALTPTPALTIPTFATALLPAGPALDATGLLNVTGVAVPPASITVASAKGGSATAPVTVGALPLPVAANDTATTLGGATALALGTPVTINVTANDTSAAGITPSSASVHIVGTPVGGNTAVNAAGTVTFTPAAGFTGAANFTYTVTDNLGQVSLPATVSITVTAATPVIPVAVNDTASTVAGTPTAPIPVLANDLGGANINSASVAIVVGSAIGGTPVVNAGGTVTFTPAAGFTGAASFSYTVKNNAVPAQTSNAAIVTVNVTAAAPPATATAVNDVANTLVSVPRIINLVANDIGALPSTVVIATQPILGALTNNGDGTVTYVSATPGTASFTYQVASTVGGVLSAPATVTVSITSAITDAVTVLKAQCTTAATKPQWLVEGNTTNVSPASKVVTIRLGNSLTGQIIGTTTTNAADGRWKFQLPGVAGNIAPVPPTISVSLPSGASRLAFPVAVTP